MCVKQALKKAQKNKKTFGNSFIYDGYINVTINSKTTNFQMRYHLSCLSGNHARTLRSRAMASFRLIPDLHNLCHSESADCAHYHHHRPDQTRTTQPSPAHPIDTPSKLPHQPIHTPLSTSPFRSVCVIFLFNFAHSATQPKRRNKAKTPRQKYRENKRKQ